MLSYIKTSLTGDVMRFFHSLMSKFKRTRSLDSIVGEKAVVVEKIDNFAGCGQVKIHGQSFSARGTEEDDVFEIGEVLRVVAIEGVKLICRK